MSVSEAYIACADPVQLIDRLCRLWKKYCISPLSETHLQVDLPSGGCELMAEVNLLQVFLYSSASDHEALRELVARGLYKAANRELIKVSWRLSLE
ncbi:hypothetical protein A9179_12830 [Pseudomonas alcaligenes]|uniref:DUF2218 domain-containing protein n=1 Tax=Aquipseudomonas alcaligenes TaxID=43263 RepID=A0ABR7S364_AQUAC|nr:hypothetical protein [Pseudomonas alcaligenes]